MTDRQAIMDKLKPAASTLARAGFASQDCQLQPFDADASLQQFVRLTRPDGQTAIAVLDCSYVADYLAAPLTQTDDLWPVAIVAAFGQAHDIPMPQVYALDKQAAVALVQDLGDEQLVNRLFAAQDDKIDPLFLLAFAVLKRLRQATGPAISQQHFVAQRRWDQATIMWETDHFFDYCWDPIAPVNGARDRLRTALRRIGDEIDQLPQVLTHRDFHARNLMMTGADSLAVIDYEDMLIGREGYDAGSIIADTYLFDRLSAEKVNHLCDLWAASQKQPVRWVRLCAMHRMLRTAGRFGWLAAHGRGGHWLEKMPHALARASHVAMGQPDLQDIMRDITLALARGK